MDVRGLLRVDIGGKCVRALARFVIPKEVLDVGREVCGVGSCLFRPTGSYAVRSTVGKVG